MSVRWLLARAFRVGCASAADRAAPGFVPRRIAQRGYLANGCWCMLKGALLLGLAALRGRVAAVRALRLVWYGAGRLHGLGGFAYEEYRTIHGS